MPLFFDVIVARSLAYLDTLLEYSTPLLKIGGHMLAMKSKDLDEELASIQPVIEPLGFSSPTVFNYSLNGSDRQIVSFKKIKNHEMKLPRRAGMADKKPLRRLLCV